MRYILIDYENIIPEMKHFDAFDPETDSIWLFINQQHKQIPIHLAQLLCQYKQHSRFILLEKTGKNALDYYLAFHIGQISILDPEAEIYIVSRDSGFDSLLLYLQNQHFCKNIFRFDPDAILPTETSFSLLSSEMESTRAFLMKCPENRPKKLKALQNALQSHLNLSHTAFEKLLKEMLQRKWIQLDNTKIIYGTLRG